MGTAQSQASHETRTDLLAALTAGIAELTTSERWTAYLAMQGRFRQYSAGNVVLIATQRPGATRVAGFATWRTMGRTVRRGERAIWILAPLVALEDSPAGREPHTVVRGFRRVAVFDVAQTDGVTLVEPCTSLQGEDENQHFARLSAVAHRLGFDVVDADFPPGRNGECRFHDRLVLVRRDNSPAQRIKTLAHELGHALLHEHEDDRARAELEAESIAYLVCHSLGLDSGSYSFGYVATWAGGGDAAILGIRASCDRIAGAARFIVDGADSRLDNQLVATS